MKDNVPISLTAKNAWNLKIKKPVERTGKVTQQKRRSMWVTDM